MSDEPSRSRRLYSEFKRAELNRAADLVCDVIASRPNGRLRGIPALLRGIPALCDAAAVLGLDPRDVTRAALVAVDESELDISDPTSLAEPGTAWFVISTMAMRKGLTLP